MAVKCIRKRSIKMNSCNNEKEKQDAQSREEALKNEILVLRRLHHPNIVQLLDVLEDKEHYYLVMDL